MGATLEPTITTILTTFVLAVIRETYHSYQQSKEKASPKKRLKARPAEDPEVPPLIQTMVAAYSQQIGLLQSEKQLLCQDVLELQSKLRTAEIELLRLRRRYEE